MTNRQFLWTLRNNRPRAATAMTGCEHRLHMGMSGEVEHAESAAHVRDQAAAFLANILPVRQAHLATVTGFDRGTLTVTAGDRVAYELLKRDAPKIGAALQRELPAVRKLTLTCDYKRPDSASAESAQREVIE